MLERDAFYLQQMGIDLWVPSVKLSPSFFKARCEHASCELLNGVKATLIVIFLSEKKIFDRDIKTQRTFHEMALYLKTPISEFLFLHCVLADASQGEVCLTSLEGLMQTKTPILMFSNDAFSPQCKQKNPILNSGVYSNCLNLNWDAFCREGALKRRCLQFLAAHLSGN